MKTSVLGFGLTAAFVLAGCGGGSGGMGVPRSTVVTVLSTAVILGGPAFINSAQHTTYTFDGDTVPNQSTCTGQCATIWPPVAPPAVTLTAPWASFSRPDATTQLSYNGKPLYTFTSDTAPGQANGDGVNGFHVARPLSGSGNGVPPGNPGYNP